MTKGILNGVCTSKLKRNSDDSNQTQCDEISALTSNQDLKIVEPRNYERENWSHHMDFILSCVGYAVGFGSIWRFPSLCLRNGGGAFLIPYLFFMIICGIPLFFLEVAIGQFAASSPVALWDICPLFKGLGWGMLIISGLCCIYYNVILTWVLYYMLMSFQSDVPWKTCNNWWNKCNCFSIAQNKTLATISSLNCSVNISKASAAEEFWKYNVLEVSESINQPNGIQLKLLGCLVAAWILIFFCLFKGVKSVGKVVYVTATGPYVFLIILLIRNSMLEGSSIGLKFYIEPKWEKLLIPQIWAEAALQVFFSLGPAWGGIITMSSYNKFHSNCHRDGIIVPVINCFTCLLCGCVIFMVVGHMSYITGSEVEKTLKAGPGLAFVAYPEAISQLPFSPVWAIIFFLLLITIGLDSQFGMFETMTGCFIDEFPNYFRSKKTLFVGVMCIIEFLISLPLITRGGIYLFTIMDWYIGTFSVCFIALFEVIVITYIYGLSKFRNNIKSMIGYLPSHFWSVMWLAITPIALITVIISSIFLYKPPSYENYIFPKWAIAFGWFLSTVSIMPLPIVMIFKLLTTEGSLKVRLRKLTKPTPGWAQGRSMGSSQDSKASGNRDAVSTNKLILREHLT